MIKINSKIVKVGYYPDGSQNINFWGIDVNYGINTITWLYENDGEIFTIMCCVNFIRQENKRSRIFLNMPYLVNSRMDRVKNKDENFSLKVFADFINALEFDRVVVKNVHSNVSMALINNIEDEGIESDFMEVASRLGLMEFTSISFGSVPVPPSEKIKERIKNTVLFFPDEGACKRYSDLSVIKRLDFQVAFGIKNRDWKTGEIKGYDVVGDVEGKDVLIVDDICSKGGTFYFAGKKLKELGAKEINLYITHCENTITEGKLLTDESPINKIFTTNSICTVKHDKIEIIHYYK